MATLPRLDRGLGNVGPCPQLLDIDDVDVLFVAVLDLERELAPRRHGQIVARRRNILRAHSFAGAGEARAAISISPQHQLRSMSTLLHESAAALGLAS
jgi:hypothetical protein